MKRIKMKTKVIFSQYWTLATIGFSEMKLGAEGLAAHYGGYDDGKLVREHLSAHRKRQWHDQEHEEGHFCHEEQKDLRVWSA